MAAFEKPVTYGLKFQARALVPCQSDGPQCRWIVGTNALRDENEVQYFGRPFCMEPASQMLYTGDAPADPGVGV